MLKFKFLKGLKFIRELNITHTKSTIRSLTPSVILATGLAALAYFGTRIFKPLKDEPPIQRKLETNIQQKLQDDKDFMEIVTNKFLIENKEMNQFMHSLLDHALHFPSLSYIFGEKGIGKTTSIQRELDKMKNIHFLYITKGLEDQQDTSKR
jgi:hypothetical protein